MWLSYNTGLHWHRDRRMSGWRSTSPNAGAFAAAMTSQPARIAIMKGVPEWPDTHTGTLYQHLCEALKIHPGACYVYPPMGHYYTHMSTSTKASDKPTGDVMNIDVRELPSHWGTEHIPGGTSAVACSTGGRQLAEYTRKGQPEYMCAPFNPANRVFRRKFLWRTQAPPSTPERAIGPQPQHHGERHSCNV